MWSRHAIVGCLTSQGLRVVNDFQDTSQRQVEPYLSLLQVFSRKQPRFLRTVHFPAMNVTWTLKIGIRIPGLFLHQTCFLTLRSCRFSQRSGTSRPLFPLPR